MTISTSQLLSGWKSWWWFYCWSSSFGNEDGREEPWFCHFHWAVIDDIVCARKVRLHFEEFVFRGIHFSMDMRSAGSSDDVVYKTCSSTHGSFHSKTRSWYKFYVSSWFHSSGQTSRKCVMTRMVKNDAWHKINGMMLHPFGKALASKLLRLILRLHYFTLFLLLWNPPCFYWNRQYNVE